MNNTLTAILTLFITFIIPSFCQGQNGTETRKFQYIGTRQGLPDGKITCLLTDHRGALWIGTDAGLARYDGYDVMTVTDHAVSEIYEDGDHNLWIRSGDMLLRYLRDEHRLDSDTETFFSSVGIDDTPKEFIFTDSDRRLWVLTHRQLYCYDFSSHRLRTVTTTLPQKQNREYISATEDSRYIYIGGCGNRLWQVDKQTGNTDITTIPAELKNGRPCVYADRNGTLWAYSTLSELLYRRISIGGVKNGRQWTCRHQTVLPMPYMPTPYTRLPTTVKAISGLPPTTADSSATTHRTVSSPTISLPAATAATLPKTTSIQ